MPLPQGALGARPGDQFSYKSLVVMGLLRTPGDELRPPIEVGDCGAVDATAANHSEVDRGVQADFAPDQHWD